MAGLRVIEHVEPHIESLARHEIVGEFAPRAELAGDLERPVPVLPLGGAPDIRAVTLVFSDNEDTGDYGPDRDRCVMLARKRNGFVLEHPPLRAFFVA